MSLWTGEDTFSSERPQNAVLTLLTSRQDTGREKGVQGRATLGAGAKENLEIAIKTQTVGIYPHFVQELVVFLNLFCPFAADDKLGALSLPLPLRHG